MKPTILFILLVLWPPTQTVAGDRWPESEPEPPLGDYQGTLDHNDSQSNYLPDQKVLFPDGVVLVDNPGLRAIVIFRPPVETASRLAAAIAVSLPPEHPNAARVDSLRRINIERLRIISDLERQFRCRVELAEITVAVMPDSKFPFHLHPDNEFGVQRGTVSIRALGLYRLLHVEPGQTGSAYIVFPKMEFMPGDVFYIVFRGRD